MTPSVPDYLWGNLMTMSARPNEASGFRKPKFHNRLRITPDRFITGPVLPNRLSMPIRLPAGHPTLSSGVVVKSTGFRMAA